MLISDAISFGKEILRNLGTAHLESEILLSFVLGKDREFLIAHPAAKIQKSKSDEFKNICIRRASGIPLAYLTHYKEFYGLGFYVDESVFIPRPETELLVEEAIRLCKKIENPCLCEIGTGSGCIAISLAKNINSAKIKAVDISEKALFVAAKNAKIHGVENRVQFIKSDLMEKVSANKFDGLVANLPYIGKSEFHFVSKEVIDWEPRLALFGGETGLELFEKLFAQIKSISPELWPNWLSLEIGFLQKKLLTELIKKYFKHAKLKWKQDLAGLDRAVTINLCGKNSNN